MGELIRLAVMPRTSCRPVPAGTEPYLKLQVVVALREPTCRRAVVVIMRSSTIGRLLVLGPRRRAHTTCARPTRHPLKNPVRPFAARRAGSASSSPVPERPARDQGSLAADWGRHEAFGIKVCSWRSHPYRRPLTSQAAASRCHLPQPSPRLHFLDTTSACRVYVPKASHCHAPVPWAESCYFSFRYG